MFRADHCPDFVAFLISSGRQTTNHVIAFQRDTTEVAIRADKAALHQIGVAEKVGNKPVRRMPVDRAWGINLFDPPAMHHHDPVGDMHGLLLIMGHEQGGNAGLFLNFNQICPHRDAQFCVEITERFIKQQNPRTIDQSPGNRDTLLLTAGKLSRHPLAKTVKTDQTESLIHPAFDFVSRKLPDPQSESNILKSRHMRKQRIGLENHPGITFAGRLADDGVALDPDVTAIRIEKTRNHAECRCLATTGRPQQTHQLSLRNLQVDTVDGCEITKSFCQPFKGNCRDRGHDCLPQRCWTSRFHRSIHSAFLAATIFQSISVRASTSSLPSITLSATAGSSFAVVTVGPIDSLPARRS